MLDTLQNYTQTTTGFTRLAQLSDPALVQARRPHLHVQRFVDSDLHHGLADYFEFLAFRNISGPNALNGILTSKVTPSFTWNSIDNPQRPHSGQSFFLAADISGIGGNVQMIRPITEYKQFIPVNHGRNVVGFRLQGSLITGYGGNVAPPFERFYMGGDTDLRGFDIRSVSPIAFLTDLTSIPLTESGRNDRPARSATSASRNLHDHHSGAAHHLPRRRYQHRHQPGIPRADRRPGHAGGVRRYRLGLRGAAIAVADQRHSVRHPGEHHLRLRAEPVDRRRALAVPGRRIPSHFLGIAT